jgi:hypothetical protein
MKKSKLVRIIYVSVLFAATGLQTQSQPQSDGGEYEYQKGRRNAALKQKIISNNVYIIN